MQEKIVNIRLYSMAFRDGERAFVAKNRDEGEAMFLSVRDIALSIRSTVKYLQEDGCESVGIDFYPFHNINCSKGRKPEICYPLTEEEQSEFLKYFFENEQ